MTFPRQVPHIPRLSELHELREDVVYAHADGVPLRFDHYRPRKVDGPAAAVIFVPGGAWMHGDPRQAAGNALHFARRGIASISLSYRLAPAHRFPAPLAAVRRGPCRGTGRVRRRGVRRSSSPPRARRTRSSWTGAARRTGGRTRLWTPSSGGISARSPEPPDASRSLRPAIRRGARCLRGEFR